VLNLSVTIQVELTRSIQEVVKAMPCTEVALRIWLKNMEAVATHLGVAYGTLIDTFLRLHCKCAAYNMGFPSFIMSSHNIIVYLYDISIQNTYENICSMIYVLFAA